MKLAATVAAALLTATAVVYGAQTFRAGTDTVLLSVTVADSSQQFVGGLARENFLIFEDGAPQEVSVFARDPQPIALSLLIDSSISMRSKLDVAQAAAIGFVKRLRPEDVAQIIAFNNETDIRQPFTANHEQLETAIRGIRLTGSTSLYTATYVALTELKKVHAASAESIRRQAIVLLSDGEDTGSLLSSDEVIDAAKRANVVIYTIALREKDSIGREIKVADYALRTLTQVTGGRLYPVSDPDELGTIYQQIADELANQYIIGYTSTNTRRDGAWRAISVRVDRQNTSVRTRSGYFAPRSAR